MARTTRPLYEIVAEIDQLIEEQVDEVTGEISEDTLAKLEALEGERDEKALNVARYMKSKKAEAAMIEAEEKKLRKRREAALRVADQMKQYIEHLLPEGTKLKDSVVNLWWSKATSVVVDDEHAAMGDERFARVTVEVDRRELKKAIESGEEVKFAHLETRPYVVVR